MRQLSLEQFQDEWRRIEAAIDSTPDIDRWCTGPDWVLPVSAGFAPSNERLLLQAETCDGYALLAHYDTSQGIHYLGSLEPLWGFGAPVFGPDPRSVAAELAHHLSERTDWQALYLPGMPGNHRTIGPDDDRPSAAVVVGGESADDPAPTAEDGAGTDMKTSTDTGSGTDTVGGVSIIEPSPFTMAVATELATLGSTRLFAGITRQVADLAGGYETWSDRRSRRFRRNLRQARRRADAAGLVFEDVCDEPNLLDRLMAVELRSWKGRDGSGITSWEMSTMYRAMIDRLVERDRLLAHVARLGDDDVGYILGGLRARRYRGLQLSYVDEADGRSIGPLSVGNLLQHHQLRLLAGEDLGSPGSGDVYDLGMDFGYKRRWADRAEPSLAVVVDRRSRTRMRSGADPAGRQSRPTR